MRVIRDASQEVEKKVICKNCGVELGYLPIDVQEDSHTDYTGDKEVLKVIVCANCKMKIRV